MTHATRTRRAATPLAGTALLLLASTALVAAGGEELDAARAGTEALVEVGAAEEAGYGLPPEGPLHECIASTDVSGAMGLHYINGDLVGDTELDPATPEALVYEPAADGGLELVALEYVVFAAEWDATNDMAPMLFGEMFMLVDEPNRYELPAFYALHAWVWEENPAGTFAAFNPDVTCAAVVPDTALEVSGPGLPVPPVAAGIGLVLVAGGMAAWSDRRAARRRGA